MKRFVMWCAVVLVAVLAVSDIVVAQDRNIELSVGGQFPLVSRRFEVEQSLGWNAQFEYRVSPRFSFALVYETLSTEDDFSSGADVDLDMYGARGYWVVSGDPGFELLAIAGLGIGELSWDKPEGLMPDTPSEIDIDLWYEAGAGVQFAGDRWNFRIQVTIRRISPKDPMPLIEGARTALVPAFNVGFRF